MTYALSPEPAQFYIMLPSSRYDISNLQRGHYSDAFYERRRNFYRYSRNMQV